MTFRSKKFMELMRDQPCGHCDADDGTIVPAHANSQSFGKGMGIKASDAAVTALCFSCHSRLDQGKDMTKDERRQFWNEAYIKTVVSLIESGSLVTRK